MTSRDRATGWRFWRVFLYLLLSACAGGVAADWSALALALTRYAAVAGIRIENRQIAVNLRINGTARPGFGNPPGAEPVVDDLMRIRSDGKRLKPVLTAGPRLNTATPAANTDARGMQPDYEADWAYELDGRPRGTA